MRLIQIAKDGVRRVAAVEGETARLLTGSSSIYELAMDAIERSERVEAAAAKALGTQVIDYAAVHALQSDWKLLPAFDHPFDEAHCMVAGTGLTHKASAENRARMHQGEPSVLTDSMRMYKMGLEGGRPEAGHIGVQPEWFYKGDGTVLRAHGEPLDVPPYGDDGGEEPEIAGAYVIAPDGKPYRVGMMQGNEFSDHVMEKKNYLYLAPSKLRGCSLGPELHVGDVAFETVVGQVTVRRGAEVIWTHPVYSGESNMSHTVANLEHHHFKYATHRRPGDAHVHFYGADAFSFGAGIALAEGDRMEVSFEGFGKPLWNTISIAAKPEAFVQVVCA